jgi:energy-coupling factor transporter ATP-binding protein EcfA2
MAAPSGAIWQWQALPPPVRLAGIFLAFMAVIWLTSWLGGISVLVALLLWCAVGIGLLHASGRLAWVDRYPWAARILEGFAPRLAIGLPTALRSAASTPAPPQPAEARGQPPSPRIECGAGSAPPVAVDLARFVGLDGVFAEIDELVATRAGRIRPVAPATLVLLVGPRGTGKSSVALALAGKLHRAGGLSSDRIVGIAPMELHGLGGSYGPSDDVLKGVSDRIQAALDGALLIDDLDWLAAGAGGQAAAEVGNRLLAVARRYPGRLFVIGTGSSGAIGRLDPANRWLSHLHVRRIDFPPLSTAALQDIFVRLLEEKGLRLADDADRAVRIQIEERRTQSGDEFDNAHAIRRLADDVLHSYGLRIHSTPPAAGEKTPPIVTAEDVRNASPSL